MYILWGYACQTKLILYYPPGMHIIRRAAFTTVPWKNGGGITHEVAKVEVNGHLLWRLSLAEVASDGPFSLFAGLARILTVIDGPGMDLLSAGGEVAHAVPPLRPVAFSGDEPLFGKLRDGPCLDFNLIYDPQQCRAVVEVMSAGTLMAPNIDAVRKGLLCLAGRVRCGEHTLGRHDFAFVDAGDKAEVLAGSQALVVTLLPV